MISSRDASESHSSVSPRTAASISVRPRSRRRPRESSRARDGSAGLVRYAAHGRPNQSVRESVVALDDVQVGVIFASGSTRQSSSGVPLPGARRSSRAEHAVALGRHVVEGDAIGIVLARRGTCQDMVLDRPRERATAQHPAIDRGSPPRCGLRRGPRSPRAGRSGPRRRSSTRSTPGRVHSARHCASSKRRPLRLNWLVLLTSSSARGCSQLRPPANRDPAIEVAEKLGLVGGDLPCSRHLGACPQAREPQRILVGHLLAPEQAGELVQRPRDSIRVVGRERDRRDLRVSRRDLGQLERVVVDEDDVRGRDVPGFEDLADGHRLRPPGGRDRKDRVRREVEGLAWRAPSRRPRDRSCSPRRPAFRAARAAARSCW